MRRMLSAVYGEAWAGRDNAALTELTLSQERDCETRNMSFLHLFWFISCDESSVTQ
jgi:hypothetical protein